MLRVTLSCWPNDVNENNENNSIHHHPPTTSQLPPLECCGLLEVTFIHDDVIKWKHFPRNWPFVQGIHRSRWIPHTKASDAELWCFSLINVWINGWVNNREAGDLRRYRAHYDVIVKMPWCLLWRRGNVYPSITISSPGGVSKTHMSS